MISTNRDIILRIFQKLPLKNYSAWKAKACLEASSGSVELNLFKSWSLGVGWGHN